MKYPRTPYFTFSDSADKEDVRESGYFNIDNFLNKELVVTIKMDGSNCLWTHDHIAARNIDSFSNVEFNKNIAKYVRANHVQTDQHWSKQKIIINKVRNNNEK